MHDNLDWIEVYLQGTSINVVASTPPPKKKHEKHKKKERKIKHYLFMNIDI